MTYAGTFNPLQFFYVNKNLNWYFIFSISKYLKITQKDLKCLCSVFLHWPSESIKILSKRDKVFLSSLLHHQNGCLPQNNWLWAILNWLGDNERREKYFFLFLFFSFATIPARTLWLKIPQRFQSSSSLSIHVIDLKGNLLI